MVKKLTQKKVKKVRSKKSKTSRIMRGGVKDQERQERQERQEQLDSVNDLFSLVENYKKNGYEEDIQIYEILFSLKEKIKTKNYVYSEFEEFMNVINIYLLKYYTFLVKKLASCQPNTNNNLDKVWRTRDGLAFLTNLIAKCNQVKDPGHLEIVKTRQTNTVTSTNA
jgi:hypothetical protein